MVKATHFQNRAISESSKLKLVLHFMAPPHVHSLNVLARASPASAWDPPTAANFALPAGASSVEIESAQVEKRRAEAASTPAADACGLKNAAVATPATSGDTSSHSGPIGAQATAATGGGGDGYVTPPLRTPAAVSADPDEHVTTAAPNEATPLTAQTNPPLPTEPPQSTQHPQDTSNNSSLSSSALFTPILFATASPLGGILSPTGNKRKRISSKRETPRDAKGRGGRAAAATSGSSSSKAATTPKRKGSSDFLRKGQWTATEEKFTRALLDAFDEGYLPIFSGVRLRGYLAVQLQCDPMRISKKLCGGTVDGKKVPKNYGQMKYKMRKPHLWDEAEAARILAELERLMRDLWCETGIARPSYLTLSSTRDDVVTDAGRYEDEVHGTQSPLGAARAEWLSDCESSSGSNSPVSSHSTTDTSAFPIIYLNLAKKHKKNGASSSGGAAAAAAMNSHAGSSATTTRRSNDGKVSNANRKRGLKVDGDSLQAAYDLLNLLQAPPDDAV